MIEYLITGIGFVAMTVWLIHISEKFIELEKKVKQLEKRDCK